MKVMAYIHSLQDKNTGKHVQAEAEIIADCSKVNTFIASYNGIICTAVYNPFVGAYFIDDVYGIIGQGRA